MQKIKKKLTKSHRKQDEQDFLLSVTVYQAKNINVQHLKSFIEVSFGGKVKTTRLAQSSSNPHFNEYMVFETRCTLDRLLRRCITFRLYHEACFRRCSGELVIDLETIWNADGRGLYGAWGHLVSCSGTSDQGERSDSCGLLQFDLDILSDNTKAPNQFGHQLAQVPAMDRQRILLSFNLYRGAFPTIGDYYVRVLLCGVEVSSKIAKMTDIPEWNQQFQFMWHFPALCNSFGIQIEAPGAIHSKIVCEEYISLKNLSHVVNGKNTMPTFGPAWCHFYKKEIYLGRILFSIQAIPLAEQIPFNRSVKTVGINKFFENDFWPSIKFKINLGIVKMDFLHSSSRNIQLQMICAENSSPPLDLPCTQYTDSNLFFMHLTGKVPAFSMDITLPDLRHILRDEVLLRNFSNQFQKNVDEKMSQDDYKVFLKDTEIALKALGKVLSNADEGETIMEWHVNFRASVVEFIGKLVAELAEFRENPKTSFDAFLGSFNQKLQHIASLGVTKWPKLFLKLLDDRGKDFGVHRVDLKDIVFLNESYGGAHLCQRRHSVLFKDPQCCHEDRHCGCITGHGEIILWMGEEKDDAKWYPDGWTQSTLSNISFIESPVKSILKCAIYLYQAKIETGLNRSSLSGTSVDIFFSGQHAKSTVKQQTPIESNWNEMVSFGNIQLECNVESYKQHPPMIFFKLYDGKNYRQDFLGIGCTTAQISLINKPKVRNMWEWIPIMRNGITVAQLLLYIDMEEVSGEDEEVEIAAPLPQEVDIVRRKFHMLFTCYGLRLMEKTGKKNFELSLEFANISLPMGRCSSIRGRTCSFTESFKFSEVDLPENPSYWPPIVIKHRREKSSKIIGLAIISNAKQFYEDLQPPKVRKVNSVKSSNTFTIIAKHSSSSNEKVESGGIEFAKNLIKYTVSRLLLDSATEGNPADAEKGNLLNSTDEELEAIPQKDTWWSKFFNSVEDENQNYCNTTHKLKVYRSELENQPEFNHFRDWADVFEMVRTVRHFADTAKKRKYCILRGHIEILRDAEATLTERIERYQQVANLSQEIPILVRVYVVRGINLRSRDVSSYSDAYITIQLGKMKISNRSSFIKNQANPIFGQCFDLKGKIPQDHILKISVMDRDTSRCTDDLIGVTLIDLEDRLFTKHKAFIGIAEEYNMFGYNMWRYSNTPVQILMELCEEYNLPEPKFTEKSLWIGEREFTDCTELSLAENLHQRLAVSALRQFDAVIPGVHLVPEHVETRSLFRSDRPGIVQGKLQLWVEIFSSNNIPPAIDISPEKPVKYELRVIVWKTADVAMKDTTILGVKMSDIYVKCWLMNCEGDTQKTDIHYRSVNGEGKFNWRMIFPFQYTECEKKIVTIKKRRIYEKYDTTVKCQPLLNVQIWDNDMLSADDFIGGTAINLNHLPVPASLAKNCSLPLSDTVAFIDLFRRKSIRGWFPIEGSYMRKELTGKVELELELLTEEEALLKPVGKHRNGPEPLKVPSRPKISFQWYKSPWKSMRHILLPSIARKCPGRWIYIGILLLILIVLFMVM